MPRRRFSLLCLLAVITGCEETPAPAPPPAGPRPDASSRFDRARTGTITGRVVWSGRAPVAPPFRSAEYPLTDQPMPPVREWPNPNAPVVDVQGGIATAVVLLRGVDPRAARPWDHPPVRVELRDHNLYASGRFVRAGDEVEVVSRQPVVHSLQFRGADFTSLALPDPDRPRRRRLAAPGVVELLSGAGMFWMRAYLFVDHHPYYAETDSRGAFRLAEVPEGEYDLVACHPNWRVLREERNSESFRVQQVRFRPPLEAVRKVRVRRGEEVRINLSVSE